MRPSTEFQVRFGVRISALCLVALSAAACSSTDRFASSDPFANPFNGQSEPQNTGSLGSAAPASAVSSQPLAPPSGYAQSSYNQPVSSPPSYNQPPAYAPAQSQSYPSASRGPSYPAATRTGWNSGPEGGSTVVVGYGDTPYSLAQRHGVTAGAILSANHLSPGATFTPGQRIVIPPRGANNPSPREALNAASQRPLSAPRGGTYTVAPGDTLFSIARNQGVPAGQLAQANGFGLDHKVRTGERLTLPNGASAAPRMAALQTPASAPLQAPPALAPKPAPVQPMAAAPEPEAKFQKAVATAEPKPVTRNEETAEATEPASSGSDFRWPARGRVISGFGSKPDGRSNDGVNLAVPEGTAVKAAESGVVAYAGNELKGYGNLVLVRHAGGWVTAYAHASEIMVKRGDTVRRGQVIAKSGKTGDVSAPQLHFEVRRGATPVDPMNHLPAG